MRKPGPNPCSTLPEEDAFSPFLSSLDSSEPDSEPRTLEVSSRTVGIPPAWGSRRQEILGSHHRKCDLNITNWDFTSDNKQFSQQKAGISPAQRRRWSNKKGGAQGQVFGFRFVGSFLEWTVKHRANIRLSGKMQLLEMFLHSQWWNDFKYENWFPGPKRMLTQMTSHWHGPPILNLSRCCNYL